MLILEVYSFLVKPPLPWDKLKICKMGRVLKLREKLGLYNMNEIIFWILIPVITGNFCIVGSQKIIKELKFQLLLTSKMVHFHFQVKINQLFLNNCNTSCCDIGLWWNLNWESEQLVKYCIYILLIWRWAAQCLILLTGNIAYRVKCISPWALQTEGWDLYYIFIK